MLVNEEKGNLECKPSLRVDSLENWVGVGEGLIPPFAQRAYLYKPNLVPRAFLRRGEDGRPSSPRRRKALGTRLVQTLPQFLEAIYSNSWTISINSTELRSFKVLAGV